MRFPFPGFPHRDDLFLSFLKQGENRSSSEFAGLDSAVSFPPASRRPVGSRSLGISPVRGVDTPLPLFFYQQPKKKKKNLGRRDSRPSTVLSHQLKEDPLNRQVSLISTTNTSVFSPSPLKHLFPMIIFVPSLCTRVSTFLLQSKKIFFFSFFGCGRSGFRLWRIKQSEWCPAFSFSAISPCILFVCFSTRIEMLPPLPDFSRWFFPFALLREKILSLYSLPSG